MKQICWLDVVFFRCQWKKKQIFFAQQKLVQRQWPRMIERVLRSNIYIKRMRYSEFIKLNGKYNIKTLCHKLYLFFRIRFHFELPKWKIVYFLRFIVFFFIVHKKKWNLLLFSIYCARVLWKKEPIVFYCFFMCSFFLLSVSFSILALFSSYR